MTYNMMLIHGMAMHGIKIIKQIKKKCRKHYEAWDRWCFCVWQFRSSMVCTLALAIILGAFFLSLPLSFLSSIDLHGVVAFRSLSHKIRVKT